MSLFEICQWIQDSSVGTSIRESTYVFPLVEATHVIGLAISVGTITIVDLRLIGAVMKKEPVTDVIEQLQPYTLTGFAAMFISGILLFWSEAARLYPSYSYRTKFVFLFLLGVNALYFHSKTYKSVHRWNNDAITPFGARMAGWIGITFWAVVIFMGRWTAYNLK
ncbi:MAG TPA: DUF6644 family protein [Bryobacteraceae bacterium]